MKHRVLLLVCLVVFVGSFLNFSYFKENESRERNGERETGKNEAMEALDFWSRARAYPDNDIPAAKYFRAFQLSRMKHKELPSIMTAGSIWDPIGPSNLQGRCLCVAVNPLNSNSIYVGTASGGLWRSFTGGLGGDWEQVRLGFPALGISSILIDPVDTNKMYIGTGEIYGYQFSNGGVTIRTMRGSYGIGILKTTDGGSTWTKSLDWTYNQQRGVEMLKFNPLNSHTIWAATSEGLYKSLDEGATWQSISEILLGEDIVINPADTNKMIVSFGNLNSLDAGVYTTPDGGNTLYLTALPLFTGKARLHMFDANPNVVYASIADSTTGVGSLWRTTNFGASWTKISDQNNAPVLSVQGWYSHYVAVHPTDSTLIVYNGASNGTSTNGGTTFTVWYPVSDNANGYADNHGYTIDLHNPVTLYAANDNGVYRSTDFGKNYTNIGHGMQTGQFFNGFSCSTTDSLIALGQSQDHIPGYRYTGTMTWDHGSAADEAGWTAIDPTNDNIMFAVSRYGQSIIRSTNRGVSFSTVANFPGNGSWNSAIVISPSNPQVIYFGDNYVRKSTDGGSSWTTTNGGNLLDGNPTLPLAVAPTSSDTAYVGTAPVYSRSHIYRTTNGGTSWTDITGTIPNRYPMDLAVDPTDGKIVYLAMGGFGSGHLYKSTDAGSTWNDMSGTLPDAPTTAIAVDPLHPSNVYVGNDISVYVSTNGGASWSSFGGGLPDAVIVADLVISPSNRALRVATHGNGAWERRLLGEMPANYFDYKAIAMNDPSDGSADSIGTALSPRATFRSLSAVDQVDSFDVKLRILSNNSEVYSAIKRLAGLKSGESRMVTFNSGFTPSQTGEYTAQAISLAPDQNSANDTSSSEFTVFGAPTMPLLTVTKQYAPYVEITGGSPGPSGDDVQLNAGIPFPFLYDGYPYDSVQISTNGWVELGHGTPGRFRGLSTSSQLGGYFTASLGTTGHPTKTLGPWWNDLSTFAAGSEISYTTTGISPSRTFIIQWKNIPAYYDAGATTIVLNFQVKLHETTNLIEFCYGPMVPGANPAVPQGASSGLKDYLGGNYRYYDLSRRASGLVSELRTDLSPLTDWPGEDSSYNISWNISSVAYSLANGWNLVSLPIGTDDHSPAALFPTFVKGTLFVYDNSYKQSDSLSYGKGYWIKSSTSAYRELTGEALSSTTINLKKGWNIIGSVDHEVAAPSPLIVISNTYGYGLTGYTIAETLVPGKGYWVKSGVDGVISLGPVVQPKQTNEQINAACTITIADRLGRKQTLYLAENSGDKINLERYEMPPLPPHEAFDARFSSQRMLEVYPGELRDACMFPVEMQSAAYPLSITYRASATNGKAFSLVEDVGNNVSKSVDLQGEGTVIIAAGNNKSLQVKVTNGGQIPIQFALKQNYPNPFNPSTTISFDIPERSAMSLILYDVLGKEVRKLAVGEYDAGAYTITCDMSNLASGVYLYRLTAGKFTDTKKLLLIR